MASNPLTIIFIGDVVGKLGRRALAELLPGLKKEFSADLAIVNGENAAHGKGITPITAGEILAAGADWITTGDHCFDQPSSVEECFNSDLPILRPANYAAGVPGRGIAEIQTAKGTILLVNLIGRSFMPRPYDCPFREIDRILEAFTDKNISAIIIDIHAETTAEKIALQRYLDGRVTAVLGTHTHVQTADARISEAGTGCLTDTGMTGAADGVIGVEPEEIITMFLTQIKRQHRLADSGRAMLNGVCLRIDPETRTCLAIEPFIRTAVIDAER